MGSLGAPSGDVPIIDIRRAGLDFSLIGELRRSINPPKGQERRLPTLLLYDEQGLKLFEDITYLDEYYLTNAEIEVLDRYADQIAESIQEGSQVVELGSGNLRKVNILLRALERARKNVNYYALDLSESELGRTLASVKGKYKYVRCHGLLGTYDDGLAWLKKPQNIQKPKCILWMGSSIGNLGRSEAADFLRGFSEVLGSQDIMLIGIDACQDRDQVFQAYNDKEGKTREFYYNGLKHANHLAGKDIFKLNDWVVFGEYDEEAGRHQAFYSPVKNVTVEGTPVIAGERIKFEESYKYSSLQSEELWLHAGLKPLARFGNDTDQYHMHIVSRKAFSYPLRPNDYAFQPVPTLDEFEQLWAAWDLVTRQIIPEQELHSKPIKLRNCCIFYLGHIPAFVDIHLTRATGNAPTSPAFYQQMFERGIDPDVENPENCHAHSEIPDEWPPTEEIIAYQQKVRSRTRLLVERGEAKTDRKVGRALWIGFEHEIMHLETLLYMVLQSDNACPPSTTPDFEALARQAEKNAVPNEWIEVPASTINIGMNDAENDDGPDRYFGWDNEKPQRSVSVPAFESKARPLTNEDYARFLDESQQQSIPASWMINEAESVKPVDNRAVRTNANAVYLNGSSPDLRETYLQGKYVRTIYGPVPLKLALHWPVFASYDELVSCARWMNGRIPTADEVHSIYHHVDINKNKHTDSITTRKVSAVNGHLSNDGVEISPPPDHFRNGAPGAEHSLDPGKLFADLEGCNVGFQRFHPTPVTQNGSKLCGQGDMGGVWEWTSSVLEMHKGFEPMALYPGYTHDFFDGKHNVVLGGSWATHPRIAGRKSFVNWYQRSYPYAWCGARLVRDVE